jgi:hypothetical protein
VIQAGPKWIDDSFELGGKKIEWGDGIEIDGADLAERLTARTIVSTRLDENIAYLRLDDGTHLAFQGISGQGEDGLICLLWEDDPPK